MVPLFKKCVRGELNNYKGGGGYLLANGSRILVRVVAKSLNAWAEKVEVLDENQAGLGKGNRRQI